MGSAEEGRLTAAIADLEQLLAHARPVPLTDQVRVRPSVLRDTIGGVDDAARSAGLGLDAAEPLAELGRIAADAKPIPLTRDVRVDPRRIKLLLDQLRPDPDRRALGSAADEPAGPHSPDRVLRRCPRGRSGDPRAPRRPTSTAMRAPRRRRRNPRAPADDARRRLRRSRSGRARSCSCAAGPSARAPSTSPAPGRRRRPALDLRLRRRRPTPHRASGEDAVRLLNVSHVTVDRLEVTNPGDGSATQARHPPDRRRGDGHRSHRPRQPHPRRRRQPRQGRGRQRRHPGRFDRARHRPLPAPRDRGQPDRAT